MNEPPIFDAAGLKWDGPFTFEQFVKFCGAQPEGVTYRYIFPEEDALTRFARACGVERTYYGDVPATATPDDVAEMSDVEAMEYCQMWSPTTFRACYKRGTIILMRRGFK